MVTEIEDKIIITMLNCDKEENKKVGVARATFWSPCSLRYDQPNILKRDVQYYVYV